MLLGERVGSLIGERRLLTESHEAVAPGGEHGHAHHPVPAGEAAVTWHRPLAGVLTLKLVAAVFPKSTPVAWHRFAESRRTHRYGCR